jgi:DNA-binding transcriptional regulator YdaS (Cro superfamily)
MMHLPPLTALRCFEAVARLGGVTLAARELHVTHSAVSQQIKLLEDLSAAAWSILVSAWGRGIGRIWKRWPCSRMS